MEEWKYKEEKEIKYEINEGKFQNGVFLLVINRRVTSWHKIAYYLVRSSTSCDTWERKGLGSDREIKEGRGRERYYRISKCRHDRFSRHVGYTGTVYLLV